MWGNVGGGGKRLCEPQQSLTARTHSAAGDAALPYPPICTYLLCTAITASATAHSRSLPPPNTRHNTADESQAGQRRVFPAPAAPQLRRCAGQPTSSSGHARINFPAVPSYLTHRFHTLPPHPLQLIFSFLLLALTCTYARTHPHRVYISKYRSILCVSMYCWSLF